MASTESEISPQLSEFIAEQPMFFVGTAAPQGRVNVSPKGMDSLRVLGPNRVVWLNLSGSGNETAAHVAMNQRMTLMFMSITKMPLIVRLFGTATVHHPRDPGWGEHVGRFEELGGSRQIFDMAVDTVTASCGTGVPIMTVEAVRGDEEMTPFYAEMSDEELKDFWTRKNTASLDGYPTHIFD